MKSVSMVRQGKLHENGLTVHQLHEPHIADKDDQKNNDDSSGANRVLFLAASSLPALYEQHECLFTYFCV